MFTRFRPDFINQTEVLTRCALAVLKLIRNRSIIFALFAYLLHLGNWQIATESAMSWGFLYLSPPSPTLLSLSEGYNMPA
jgi:hypothetical protein